MNSFFLPSDLNVSQISFMPTIFVMILLFSLASKSVEISLSNAVAQNDFDVFVSLFVELNVKLYKSNRLFYFG